LLSIVLTWSVRYAALSFGVIARRATHHIHKHAVPRLGGVAIYCSFLIVLLSISSISSFFDINIGVSRRAIIYILFPGTLIFLLGLFDDIRPLTSYTKLAVQTLAAVILFAGGFGVFNLPPLFGVYSAGLLALPLTVLWVLWITNAFNLIDGIDGLAAGSALFSTVTVFLISLINGNSSISLLTITLIGSILGFLRFNLNPATIFLGDSGSLFIGFMLSAVALVGVQQKTPIGIAVAIPVVSYGLPILETAISVVRRFVSAKPLLTADREHIHHKLLEQGFSQRQVVVVLYAVSAFCGLLSLFLLYPGTSTAGIVLIVFAVGVYIGIRQLKYHEFVEIGRIASRTMEQPKVVRNNLSLRRATERLAKSTTLSDICNILTDAFDSNDFDGFNLKVKKALRIAAISHAEDQVDRDWSHFPWQKSSGASLTGTVCAPKWTLELELVSNETKVGEFSLWRIADGQPVLVDINLVTTDLQNALSKAIGSISVAYDKGAKQSNTEVMTRAASH
jgi:UDP-GlcNAc:undecaprenyl-phosphate GlcNAc-1-phosphate transferase